MRPEPTAVGGARRPRAGGKAGAGPQGRPDHPGNLLAVAGDRRRRPDLRSARFPGQRHRSGLRTNLVGRSPRRPERRIRSDRAQISAFGDADAPETQPPRPFGRRLPHPQREPVRTRPRSAPRPCEPNLRRRPMMTRRTPMTKRCWIWSRLKWPRPMKPMTSNCRSRSLNKVPSQRQTQSSPRRHRQALRQPPSWSGRRRWRRHRPSPSCNRSVSPRAKPRQSFRSARPSSRAGFCANPTSRPTIRWRRSGA